MKLQIKVEPWRAYFAVDGETAYIPVDADNTGYTLEIDGDIRVLLHGQAVPLEHLRAGAWGPGDWDDPAPTTKEAV